MESSWVRVILDISEILFMFLVARLLLVVLSGCVTCPEVSGI